MAGEALQFAIKSVPAGAWAVGVSGGADSVALLSLLRNRSDLSLRVVHLDHQTRGDASSEDARFVQMLANQWGIPCDIERLDQVVNDISDRPKNRSALFRAARLALFRRVVSAHDLRGVILAHHADDQAETILLRLLRGSSYAGLAGMSARTTIGGLVILRPLLALSRQALREHLRESGQTWREDESNKSARYARNRVRFLLEKSSHLTQSLIELGKACNALRRWANHLPDPPERLPLRALQVLPSILARQQARKWLTSRGIPARELLPAVLDRLIAMASDRATPVRQQFPGGAFVRRRKGLLCIERYT
jgi:tRNA(Ile)-lysidine synthetase-like protein